MQDEGGGAVFISQIPGGRVSRQGVHDSFKEKSLVSESEQAMYYFTRHPAAT